VSRKRGPSPRKRRQSSSGLTSAAVLVGILAVAAVTTAAVIGAVALATRVEPFASIPGAAMPVIIATVAVVGVGVPLLLATLVTWARSAFGRGRSADVRLILLAAIATIVGAVVYAGLILGVLWLLAFPLPDGAVEFLGVVLGIAGLPFVGPIIFRLSTGRAPDEKPGGLLPPLPRRLRHARRSRGSLATDRQARKDDGL